MSETLNSPSQVVREVFAALEHKDWAGVVRRVHPSAISAFRDYRLRIANARNKNPNEMEMAAVGIPAAVMTFFREMDLKRGDPSTEGFARVAGSLELERLDPEIMLARWLEGHDADAAEAHDPLHATISRTVIGEVRERDDTVHVVYRISESSDRSGKTEQVDAITAVRSAGPWLLLLNDDLSCRGIRRPRRRPLLRPLPPL